MSIGYARAAEVLPQDRNEFLQSVVPALMSHEIDADRLATCPHMDVPGTDLAIVARYNKPGTDVSALISNDVARLYHLTGSEIIHQATAKMSDDSFEIRPMADVLRSMMGDSGFPLPEEMESAIPLYVLRSKDDHNPYGAVELINPAAQHAAAKILDGDYYVLPSSKYEVLLLPANGNADVKELTSMVADVNKTVVAPQEQLSNSVLFFDSKVKLLIKATEALANMCEQSMELGRSNSHGR